MEVKWNMVRSLYELGYDAGELRRVFVSLQFGVVEVVRLQTSPNIEPRMPQHVPIAQ